MKFLKTLAVTATIAASAVAGNAEAQKMQCFRIASGRSGGAYVANRLCAVRRHLLGLQRLRAVQRQKADQEALRFGQLISGARTRGLRQGPWYQKCQRLEGEERSNVAARIGRACGSTFGG